MSEFGIHGVQRIGNDAVVIGRCYRGLLRVGDVFRTATTSAGGKLTVHLAILEIEAYQRKLNQIDEGLTAKLALSGEGTNDIADGSVLSTE